MTFLDFRAIQMLPHMLLIGTLVSPSLPVGVETGKSYYGTWSTILIPTERYLKRKKTSILINRR
jgi:hypothetical protein